MTKKTHSLDGWPCKTRKTSRVGGHSEYPEGTNAINGAGPAFSTWSTQNPGSTITTVTQWLAQTPPLPAAEPFATNYQNALADFNNQLAIMSQIAQTADALLSQAQANYNNTQFQQTYATSTGVSVTEGIAIVGNTDGTLNPVTDWAAWSTGQSNGNRLIIGQRRGRRPSGHRPRCHHRSRRSSSARPGAGNDHHR